MPLYLLKLICPAVLFISVFYPFWRGLKHVKWWKSVLIGWAFFLGGCLIREYVTPWLAGGMISPEAKAEVTCANSYMLFGIALGWLFPLIFHWLGVSTANEIEKRRNRETY